MDEQKGGLLLVLAHPDDESMGTGGLILRHTRKGIPTHLICATFGEAGWMGKPPGAKKEDLKEIRAKELEDAAEALALSGVELWDYADGGVQKADQQEITQRIWKQVAKLRPRVVVGWGPDGGYGHPDHIAIGACTDAALASMAETERPALYHIAADQQTVEFYREAAALGGEPNELPMQAAEKVDLVIELDADEVMMKMRAIDCHRSQLEDWRIKIREHSHLMHKGYGHEPYIAVSSRTPSLTAEGLLGEFV
ncbi:MAG TPA: PIG-L family deacetylase [Candidatus Dormibacteraeota bacterium]|nr:PIG-L family deacetylase [Candidatus Dormibacteraeota bacterium]